MYHQQQNGSAMANLLNQSRNPKRPQKNFMAENRTALKEAHHRNATKRCEEEYRKTKVPYKMERFKNIGSRLNQSDENTADEGTPRKEYLRRDTGMTSSSAPKKPPSRSSSSMSNPTKHDSPPKPSSRPAVQQRKPAVPKANEATKLAPRSRTDFVLENRVDAIQMAPRRKEDQVEAKASNYGKVPGYLVKRKEEWEAEAEARRAAAPDPSCPPGMTVMPEEERVETLRVLRESQAETTRLLSRMPFRVETISMKRKKGALEAKLQELESAIKMFDRERVLVAD